MLNARDASWIRSDERGQDTDFEGGQEWPLGLPHPESSLGGQRGMYQEDFLVVSGECLLVIEGEERPLKAWDFVHCPPWTRHVFVGTGDGPCVIVDESAAARTASKSSIRQTTWQRSTMQAYFEEPRDKGWLCARRQGSGQRTARGGCRCSERVQCSSGGVVEEGRPAPDFT